MNAVNNAVVSAYQLARKSVLELRSHAATHFFTAVLAHTKFQVFKLKCVVSGIFVSKPNGMLSA